MRRFLPLLLCLLVSLSGFSQDLKNLRRKSYQTFVYRIPADSAEKYITKDSIPVDVYLNRIPDYTVQGQHVNIDSLPKGHYLWLWIDDNKISAGIEANSDLVVYAINNDKFIQLAARDRQGNDIVSPKAWLNRKPLQYLASAGTFKVRYRPKETDLVKVCSATDTVFLNIEVDNEDNPSVLQQKWRIFKGTRVGRWITYVPRKLATLFSNNPRYSRGRAAAGKGFIVFNQPKYKIGDTVKLKAYILDGKNRRYNKKAGVYLQYATQGKNYNQHLGMVSPAASASYLYEFVLRDTLHNDLRYNLVFQDRHHRQLVRNYFSVEDYVLDEVATYTIRSAKETYYPGDSLVFIMNAKDANGLNLLDGSVRLLLVTTTVEKWTKDSVIVADTLYDKEVKLDPHGDTRISIGSSVFPAASVKLSAKAIFRNSNNELQEESTDIGYSTGEKELVVRQEKDSLFAEYRVNGKSVPATGAIEIEGDLLDIEKELSYPAAIKIDPLADTYYFYIGNDSSLDQKFPIEGSYNLSLAQFSNNDTLGFRLANPYRVPVFYSVTNGDRVIATGKADSAELEWHTIERNPRQAYRVKWQYFWAGEERTGEEPIGHLYKKLAIGVHGASFVFPGQKDTITVEVTDYRHRAAANVNLTAFSYNSQFKKDIRIPGLPYTARYRLRPGIKRDTYIDGDAYIIKSYPLGYHPQWIAKFRLDTMLYYRMLFPQQEYFDVTTLLEDYYPQVSVHVVQEGMPQPVYLLHINNNLVYYNGVSGKKNYSFYTVGGYAKIGFRLRKRYVEVDSIYIQPNYKHDIVFDLDKLPSRAKVTLLDAEFTPAERALLENSLWQYKAVGNPGTAYAWQNGEAVKLNPGSTHIAGPFRAWDSLHFFAPGRFDLHFLFEPGYQYQLSPKTSRLEKMKVFPNQDIPVKLPAIAGFSWALGDTVMQPPVIGYNTPAPVKYLRHTNDYYYYYKSNIAGTGSLVFRLPNDKLSLQYVVLYPVQDTLKPIVIYGDHRNVYNIPVGVYTLLLVGYDFRAASLPVAIRASHTTCIKISRPQFSDNALIDRLAREAMEPATASPSLVVQPAPLQDISGNEVISGRVIDDKGGKAIPGASVMINGTTARTLTNSEGNFLLKVKRGKYTFTFSGVGYASKEISVDNNNTSVRDLVIRLYISKESLQEVVVTGYGMSRQMRSVTGSVSVVKGMSITQELAGKVAGLTVTGDMSPYRGDTVRIRGFASASGGEKPIYVIDGIIYDELPGNISPADMASIEILKDAAAMALYGSRAANGVVVITTKTKALRTQFRDYATWQPLLFTGEDGKAKFVVTYPDNVTSWQTYVMGIDKKNRSGVGGTVARSYKPVMAQLSVPQFAVEGDSITVIAKAVNYTKDKYTIGGTLSSRTLSLAKWDFDLPSSESVVNTQQVVAGTDSIILQYNIATTTGFKDGEERKLPVYPKGTEESTGSFYILERDTAIGFTAEKDAVVHMHVQNNTFDMLLDELGHLRQYPYYCMEQVASKIKGYRLEQQVREALHQEFTHAKDMQRLLEKLQHAQRYDGSWSWWDKGNPDVHITNYILQALLPLRSYPLVEANVRNALLFLQNNIDRLGKEELLYTLSSMAQAGHVIDYQPWLSKINFDSLTLHQQWMFTQVKQLLRLDHARELNHLLGKKSATVFGGTYWGEETWLWYNNDRATTVLAYTVLQDEPQYRYLLPSITRYFLETRAGGYWRNTVESASITAALLPQVLKENKTFTAPASLTVTGDTAFTVSSFPFTHSFGNNIRQLQVQKQGGGFTYLTLYQNWWNKTPQPVADKFIVSSHFESNGNTVQTLRAGERAKLKVQVKALQRAEYVMIEVPVPAGCILVNKTAGGYIEYFKNKAVIFTELLAKGDHSFDIELECRYPGRYTLNPATASLMYFPVFYGRNEMRSVEMR